MERTQPTIGIIEGFAFDLEGTLIDLESIHHEAHLLAAADFGLFLTWREAFDSLPHFIGGPDEIVAEEISSLAGKDVRPREVLMSKRHHFNLLLKKRKHIEPRKGFKAVIQWIKSNNFPIAIGTVTDRHLAKQLLLEAKLNNLTSDHLLVAREDVARPKPSPEVYLETARRIGISPTTQLVFEDSVIGVEAAVKAGSLVVAVPSLGDPRYVEILLTAGAYQVFYEWNQPELLEFLKKTIGA